MSTSTCKLCQIVSLVDTNAGLFTPTKLHGRHPQYIKHKEKMPYISHISLTKRLCTIGKPHYIPPLKTWCKNTSIHNIKQALEECISQHLKVASFHRYKAPIKDSNTKTNVTKVLYYQNILGQDNLCEGV